MHMFIPTFLTVLTLAHTVLFLMENQLPLKAVPPEHAWCFKPSHRPWLTALGPGGWFGMYLLACEQEKEGDVEKQTVPRRTWERPQTELREHRELPGRVKELVPQLLLRSGEPAEVLITPYCSDEALDSMIYTIYRPEIRAKESILDLVSHSLRLD